jgi:ATP-dependent DNA helicase Rep
MSSMNAPQREAVMYTQGPLLVLAGAGSGKTRVITEKIAHLIASGQREAKHIAAITFTNKAAKEMRERVAKRVRGDAAEGLTISTFHALGLRFLQQEAARAGLKRGFSVFDSDDQMGIVKDLLPAGTKNDVLERLRGLVSRAKNEALTPEQAAELAKSAVEREAAKLYEKYQARLAAFNAVDFDDLIRLPVLMLEADEDFAAAWRERIRYLLVDECQDTNGAQYRLLKQLAGPRGAFTCVGDDDQSIYAWRGAQPENLELLGSDYPNLKVVKLEQNYRCASRILRLANTLIANNPHANPKTLWSDQREGEKIKVWRCENNEHEADRVAAEIDYLNKAKEIPFADFAILFRGNHQSRALEKSLQMLRIPYHLTGGTAFLDRAEVKDALGWLRLIANPEDDAAFLRAVTTPARGIGGTSLARLAELAQQHHMPMDRAARQLSILKQLQPRIAAAVSEFTGIVDRLRDEAESVAAPALVRSLVERSGMLDALRAQTKDKAGFERRRANLEELADWFDGPKSAIGDLAAQMALLTHADRGEPGNAVRLMSLHGSKGLEFRAVFLVGLEDGTLPHEASMEEGRLEEERRLLYVGITRAKEHLVLSHSLEAKRWGDTLRLQPSRFLAELPQGDLARDGADPEAEAESKKARGRAHLAAMAALFDEPK